MTMIAKKQTVHASVVLERFEGQRLSNRVKAALSAFRRAHDAYGATNAQIGAARARAEDGLKAVHAADAALDAAILELADQIAGARLGSRTNPFADFSEHTPASIVRLGYAREVQQLRKLARNLERVRPTAAVAGALRQCLARADAVERALTQLSPVRTRLEQLVAARVDLVAPWRKAFRRLKTQAAAFWVDDPELYRAIFAPADRVQQPMRRKRMRRAEATASPQAASRKRAAL